MASPSHRGSEPGDHQVFDRRLVRAHRDRAAGHFAAHDFLQREIAERLIERLDDIKRRFPLALELGCRTGIVRSLLKHRGGVETLIECDLSDAMVRHAAGPCRLVADEELLPIRDGSLDLVIAVLSLHWVNDLPGALIQIRRALKPDGLFLGALFGGETLHELRVAWVHAELERVGGASPRVSPVAAVEDMGGLMQRAGFALPVIDTDHIVVTYPDPIALMRELRGMGETNACRARRGAFTARGTLFAAADAYRRLFATSEGRVPATFQTIYLTGWSPDPSQQQPAKRGSGTVKLATALRDDADATASRDDGDDGISR
jgi:SAM-dependent methyltransferase